MRKLPSVLASLEPNCVKLAKLSCNQAISIFYSGASILGTTICLNEIVRNDFQNQILLRPTVHLQRLE
jgi:hypothetical protein